MNSSTRAIRFTLGLCSALLVLALPVQANPERDDADAFAAQQISAHESEQWSRELAEQLVDDGDAIGQLTGLLALWMTRQIEFGFNQAGQGSEWQAAKRRAVDAAIAEQHLGALHALMSVLGPADADPALTERVLHSLDALDSDNLAVVLYRLRARNGAVDASAVDELLQTGAAASHHNLHVAATLAQVVERAAQLTPPPSLLDFTEAETGVRDPRFASAVPMLGIFAAFATPEFISLSTRCESAEGQRRQHCLAIARTLSLKSSDAISQLAGARLWKQLAEGDGDAALADQAWRDLRWQIAATTELATAELEAADHADDLAAARQASRKDIDALLSGIEESQRIRQRLLDAGISLSAPAGWVPES